MAVTYGFFNSVNGDRKYNAEQMSEYFRGIINEGVYQHLDGGLAVTAGTGLAVNVAAGRAIIQNRWVQNSAAMSLTIAAASETYARKDAVVIRLNWSSRSISIAVKTGTPAASPVAPSMTRNSTTYEMALAYVNVAANATSVTVTDKRSDSTVCGWVTVAQSTSGEVDQMLDDMKTGFDGVTYASPAAMVQGEDAKIYDLLKTAATSTITWTDGYYLDSNNNLISHDLFSVTNMLNIRNYREFIVHSYMTGGCSILLYDSDQTKIGSWRNVGSNYAYSLRLNMDDFPDAMYIRFCAFTSNKNESFILPIPDQSNIHLNDIPYTASSYPSLYHDANNLPFNSFISIHFGWNADSGFVNYPYTNFQGTILTVNNILFTKATTFGLQIAFAETTGENANKVFIRSRYTSWSQWIEIANTSMISPTSSRSNGGYRGLGTFTLCGDSLSVSLAYKQSGVSKTVKSWGKILADMMGSSCNVFAQGGFTTGVFLSSELYTNAVADEAHFAIIYLGTNDANQSVSAETFRSNYESIINGLLTNHQFVLCCNLPEATSASNRDTYNNIIADICNNNANAFMIDVAQYNSNFASMIGWGHLSSVGYAAFAEAASWAIDDLLATNSYFDISIDFPS